MCSSWGHCGNHLGSAQVGQSEVRAARTRRQLVSLIGSPANKLLPCILGAGQAASRVRKRKLAMLWLAWKARSPGKECKGPNYCHEKECRTFGCKEAWAGKV